MAKPILKLFRPSDSPIILGFWLRVPIHNSKGKSHQLARKVHGVGKFCDFRLKSPFISETVRD